MPDKSVLDLTRLEEAFEDDTAGISELLGMALATGAKHRAALADAIATGDATAIARAAHSIKGSASNIGAPIVAELAAELEQRARAGEIADAAARVEAIAAAYVRLAGEVDAYRASLS